MSALPTLSFDGRPVFTVDSWVDNDHVVVGLFDGHDHHLCGLDRLPALFDLIENRPLILDGFSEGGDVADVLLKFLLANRNASQADVQAFACRLKIPWSERSDQDRAEINAIAFGVRAPWSYTIDLGKVITKPRLSLAAWQCRLGRDRVTPGLHQGAAGATREVVEGILRERVSTIALLLERSRPLLAMRTALIQRYQLDFDLYTKTEPQIAERVVTTLYARRTGCEVADLTAAAASSPDNTRSSIPVAEVVAPDITFSTPALQTMFADFKAGRVECIHNADDKPALNLVTTFPDNVIDVAGISCKLSCGGLHSTDKPLVATSTAESVLLDFDARSFYPAIVINKEIRPFHFSAELNAILAGLRQDRFAAIDAGDKITADALKIIINSVFGKFQDQFSALRSTTSLLRVTINGQLYLLMLVEQLSTIGCTIISLNTDGVLIQVRRDLLPILERTIGAWQETVQFTLERTDIARYWRSNINNYIAELVNGSIKSKGWFNPEADKASGAIVIRAAQEYLVRATDPAETIGRHGILADFLFTHEAWANTTLELDGQPVESVVRWYLSSDGLKLTRRKAGEKRKVVDHGESITVLPDATGTTLATVPNLDRGAYVAAARRLIAQAREYDLIQQATMEGERLRAMGLVLAPKRLNGHDLKGVRLDSIERYETEFGHHPGYAIVTGQAVNTLIIDLDDPTLVPADLFRLLPSDTLISWHGDGAAADVLSGRRRGAVTMRYDGDDARIRSEAMIDTYGFEVAYGRKHQTVIGIHRSAADTYASAGTVQDAPPELISLLGNLLGAPPRTKREAGDAACSTATVEDLTSPTAMNLTRLLAACRTVYGATWGRIVLEKRLVEGPTPGKETNLWIFLRPNGKVGVHSLHKKFNQVHAATLVQTEYDRLSADTSADHLPL